MGQMMGQTTLTPTRGCLMPDHYFWLSDAQFARL